MGLKRTSDLSTETGNPDYMWRLPIFNKMFVMNLIYKQLSRPGGRIQLLMGHGPRVGIQLCLGGKDPVRGERSWVRRVPSGGQPPEPRLGAVGGRTARDTSRVLKPWCGVGRGGGLWPQVGPSWPGAHPWPSFMLSTNIWGLLAMLRGSLFTFCGCHNKSPQPRD